ncbi:hypothetical protein SDRG_16211 [Saprolegnia diclina VS20]|uniref:Uncharacterized protein n=1 Tax=Saprolegnia diclina (strain VS20) TaxID=1156394 RepID=T0PKV1_SAPDV|nr:hypothetical protein SDRG_16211 [Saprolegnia diclina VS20]EQC25954.1 hypothetical protein SDRG_16211 [Saprolegnia diclina VS20]|eukprot:XP_008620634.1 hypothetical protein SDRG_16211 [Saprolegnia diclina VS20]
MALLCNACPPAMADVFETWRADEPAWDYAYVRRQLVEHWAKNRPLVGDASPPALVADVPPVEAPPAVVERASEASAANEPAADENLDVQIRALARDLALASHEADRPSTAAAEATARDVDTTDAVMELAIDDDVDAAPASTSTSSTNGRREKRGPDATDESQDSASQQGHKRPKPASTPIVPQQAVGRPQEYTGTRISPRQHLIALRVLHPSPAASSPDVVDSNSDIAKDTGGGTWRFTEEEVAFLCEARQLPSRPFRAIYSLGRDRGLFLTRPLRSVQAKYSRMKKVATATVSSTSVDATPGNKNK